ncbi:MAG: PHP domain-containing protein [Halapricum sp.]
MIRADLHVHTTISDGELDPEAVPAVARQAGLDAVAITDHDRLQPGLDGPVVRRDGVTVVHGIELRVDAGRQRVDLLGYGLEATPELEAACERIQRDRIERARAIVDCIEDRLGVVLDVDVYPGVGRPHIARAIEESDAEFGYQEAFEALIGDGDPCFVAREIPDFETGRRLLDEAAAFVGLAHPLRYRDREHALGLAAELDAVELSYPYDRDVDRDAVRRAIDRHELLATGGSDAHGRRLGIAGLDAEAFERVHKRLPHPTVG